ncbi:hypothetical protein [Paractinoplanes atraurantiacus]|uniref:Uncharacterized protein n=1 Tax=Paractinoplanes atraurantiacus TaxID=1036182 RepID=A0A285K331_9ACTN|nr:hypothetical protein [Actinoplanes atraurantiacus]SNY66974.1 hypothetical protein SAMN05421748_1316 [Actinoplanes atraurantiacus]
MGTDRLAALRDLDVPPLDVSIDRAVATGRRRVAMRRAGAAAFSVLAVAGVVAAVNRPPDQKSITPAANDCQVAALAMPAGEKQVTTTAIDPAGRFITGAVPASEETGGQGRALLWTDGQVKDLGVTGFGPTPLGVNAGGTVVGGVTRGERQVAWAWTNGTLRILPVPAGSDATANAINTRGDIVGVVAGRAAFWPAADPLKVHLLNAPGESGALGIGDEELIVGHAAGKPYVWKSTVEGGPLPSTGEGSATAISGDWIVGTSGPSTREGVIASPRMGPNAAGPTVRWQMDGKPAQPVPGMAAAGITSTGVVAGVTTKTELNPPYREATLSTRRLPHLSADRDYDVATAISADGTVIAGEQPSETVTRPLIWRC